MYTDFQNILFGIKKPWTTNQSEVDRIIGSYITIIKTEIPVEDKIFFASNTFLAVLFLSKYVNFHTCLPGVNRMADALLKEVENSYENIDFTLIDMKTRNANLKLISHCFNYIEDHWNEFENRTYWEVKNQIENKIPLSNNMERFIPITRETLQNYLDINMMLNEPFDVLNMDAFGAGPSGDAAKTQQNENEGNNNDDKNNSDMNLPIQDAPIENVQFTKEYFMELVHLKFLKTIEKNQSDICGICRESFTTENFIECKNLFCPLKKFHQTCLRIDCKPEFWCCLLCEDEDSFDIMEWDNILMSFIHSMNIQDLEQSSLMN